MPKKSSEEKAQWESYRKIRKADWVRMSGRQQRTIDQQARRYGLPLLGSPIDLAAFARRLHDFLDEHAATLAKENVLEQLNRVKLQREQLKLAEMRGELVRVEQVAQAIMMVFSEMGRGVEMARQAIGIEPMSGIINAIDRAQAQWQGTFREAAMADSRDAASKAGK